MRQVPPAVRYRELELQSEPRRDLQKEPAKKNSEQDRASGHGTSGPAIHAHDEVFLLRKIRRYVVNHSVFRSRWDWTSNSQNGSKVVVTWSAHCGPVELGNSIWVCQNWALNGLSFSVTAVSPLTVVMLLSIYTFPTHCLSVPHEPHAFVAYSFSFAL